MKKFNGKFVEGGPGPYGGSPNFVIRSDGVEVDSTGPASDITSGKKGGSSFFAARFGRNPGINLQWGEDEIIYHLSDEEVIEQGADALRRNPGSMVFGAFAEKIRERAGITKEQSRSIRRKK